MNLIRSIGAVPNGTLRGGEALGAPTPLGGCVS